MARSDVLVGSPHPIETYDRWLTSEFLWGIQEDINGKWYVLELWNEHNFWIVNTCTLSGAREAAVDFIETWFIMEAGKVSDDEVNELFGEA